ncbi:BRO family protein [uncultured Cohaesibacter sp.]|uniref:BRO-N domain-containing protein n=1 Tax=uncultured Cohaesibacter sp. TaxID=1002546 RepID=UPI002AAA7FB5|nr:BRO family protein [uncultured Cohaesibacter sp.]
MIDGEPWFVAADVLRALDVYIQKNGKPNVTMGCRKLCESEKGVNPIYTPTKALPDFHTPMMCVSESGLYKLVMRSDKPQAKKFQDWVTRDVLPTIRKTGQYNVHAAKVASGEMSLTEMTMKVLEGLQEQLRMEQEKETAINLPY